MNLDILMFFYISVLNNKIIEMFTNIFNKVNNKSYKIYKFLKKKLFYNTNKFDSNF
jgi:hypothetical protein